MTPHSSDPIHVVLVHGAFSDASYWRKVLTLLGAQGVSATAAQVNVQGFSEDVTALQRHLDARPGGGVLLVGHSYGGAVISQVAAQDPRVKGLVYVSAAAPLVGVPFDAWMAEHPCDYATTPRLDSSGFLWLPYEDCLHGMAHDLTPDEALLLHALQKPVLARAFGDSATAEGWRDKPCWYLVSENDRLIPPTGQHELAAQMGAVTRTVASGHMVALSRPDAVVDIISEAMASLSATASEPTIAPVN